MKTLRLLLIVCLLTTGSLPMAVFGQQARFGINLSPLTTNSTEFVYKDLIKLMVLQRVGSGFTATQFDANGYPKSLNSGQSISLSYGSGTRQLWPTGDYHLFFDGQGTIAENTGTATLKQDLGNGHQIWTVIRGSSDYLQFAITSTNSSNYLKNLRIIMPGFESNYVTDPIHPTFRSNWGMFSAFRFMDWLATNNSPTVDFAKVMPAGYISQVGYSGTWGNTTFPSDPVGGSPELAADLCNRMNKDMWITIPHKASDALINQLATLIKSKLNPGLKVYLEYSNEVWNWAFQQASYSRDQGVALGLTTGGALEYYVYRSGQMYKIWEDVYGVDKNRVINVFAWQTTTGNPDMWINKAINEWFKSTKYNPAGAQPEFYANAPYIWDKSASDPASVDELFAGAFTEDLQVDKDIMSSQKAFATANGLEYGAYEAGQHYSSYGQNEALDLSVLVPANRDPRMGTLYTDYLNYWKNNIGGLMMLYNTTGPYSKWGSWGLLEYHNQNLATSYKYQAVKNVIASLGGGDTQAPAAPTNLASPAKTAATVNLSWSASTDNVGVTGYEIFRGTTLAGTSASTSYQVTGLSASTTYSFTVKAYDAAGNRSAASNSVSVTTDGSTSLRTPENPASTVAGVDYKYYEGTWSALPNFSTLTPVKSGNVANFDMSVRNRTDNYAFQYTGFVSVPGDGTYTFYTSSDDGSKLYIGSTEVVNNDGLHGMQERSGTIGLRAGKHAITVTFFEGTGGEGLTVHYAGPGNTKTTIPNAALFRATITPPPATGFSGTYKITARHSGKALDVNQGSTADGTNVQQWPTNGATSQQWIITPTTDGYYKVVSKASGKALEVSNSSLADGANVQQWAYVGYNNQQWKIEATTDGYHRLLNRNSGKALDVAGFSTADGANVQQYTYSGGNNQQWKLELLSTATARLAEAPTADAVEVYPNPSTGGFVHVKLASKAAGTASVELTNAVGQSASRQAFAVAAGQKTLRVSTAGLSKGIYLLSLRQGSTRTVKKIHIQ